VLVPHANKPVGFRWGFAGASLPTRVGTPAGKILGRGYTSLVFSPLSRIYLLPVLSDKNAYKLNHEEEPLCSSRNSL
jgi:hypothetical protein